MKIKIVILGILSLSFAQALIASESVYTDVARAKKYVGGADETELKVQLNLKQSSKLNKKLSEPRKKQQQLPGSEQVND